MSNLVFAACPELNARLGPQALTEELDKALGGRVVELTTREYELLEYLVRHKGMLVSREMLARDVWGETQRSTPLDNVIDVHIAHLRKRIDHNQETRLIHTVRGVGFILREGEAP